MDKISLFPRGQLGEWLNPVAWNAAVAQATVSSNLTLSTTFFLTSFAYFL